jgi:hypothetical protein
MVQKIKPDIIGHITGGPIPMPEEDMIRIASETECFMEICTSGNYRLALVLARLVKAKNLYQRVLIGTDTPGGTGLFRAAFCAKLHFCLRSARSNRKKLSAWRQATLAGRTISISAYWKRAARRISCYYTKSPGRLPRTRSIHSAKVTCRGYRR